MLTKSLDTLIHFQHYKKKVLLSEESYFLGYTIYDDYPLHYIENADYLIHIEGCVYNKKTKVLENELINFAPLVFIDYDKDKIADWLLGLDGDYIFFFLNKKTKDIAIINDPLGRLPLYFCKTNNQVLVSREVGFITELIENTTFDRMGIAQYLLFGYALGERSLLENVYRVDAATLIRINSRESTVEMNNVSKFNFEIKQNSEKNININANELFYIFNEVCKSRAGQQSNIANILSLSGGLDSRTIGASLCENNIDYHGVTRLSFNNKESVDAKIAAQLAKVFDIDWQIFNIPPPTGKDLSTLLNIKNGLNPLTMSFILPFFIKTIETFGLKIRYFTGDGGDKMLPDLRPTKKIHNIEGLLNYILSNNQIFSLDDVVSLTNIRKEDIINELNRHLLSYPEADFNQKYVHFLIYERAFKWLFEGEDRTRCYFWNVAPFYAIPFLQYAMSCPDTQKNNYKLYSKFLLNFTCNVASINNASWNTPIVSRLLPLKLLRFNLSRRLPSNLRQTLKKLATNTMKDERDNSVTNCILEQMNHCDAISDYLSYSEVERLTKSHSKTEHAFLLTITSYIEKIKCYRSSLENYIEHEFK